MSINEGQLVYAVRDLASPAKPKGKLTCKKGDRLVVVKIYPKREGSRFVKVHKDGDKSHKFNVFEQDLKVIPS